MSNQDTYYVTKGHSVHTRSRKILKPGQQAHKKDFGSLNWEDLLLTGQIKTFKQIEDEARAKLAEDLPQQEIEGEEDETPLDSVQILGEEDALDPEKVTVVALNEGTADPKPPQGPWCEDPESLQDKDLEDLQLMVADRDRDGSMEELPETKEGCIALLSRNFQPA